MITKSVSERTKKASENGICLMSYIMEESTPASFVIRIPFSLGNGYFTTQKKICPPKSHCGFSLLEAIQSIYKLRFTMILIISFNNRVALDKNNMTSRHYDDVYMCVIKNGSKRQGALCV